MAVVLPHSPRDVSGRHAPSDNGSRRCKSEAHMGMPAFHNGLPSAQGAYGVQDGDRAAQVASAGAVVLPKQPAKHRVAVWEAEAGSSSHTVECRGASHSTAGTYADAEDPWAAAVASALGSTDAGDARTVADLFSVGLDSADTTQFGAVDASVTYEVVGAQGMRSSMAGLTIELGSAVGTTASGHAGASSSARNHEAVPELTAAKRTRGEDDTESDVDDSEEDEASNRANRGAMEGVTSTATPKESEASVGTGSAAASATGAKRTSGTRKSALRQSHKRVCTDDSQKRRVAFGLHAKTHDGLCRQNHIFDTLIWQHFSKGLIRTPAEVAGVVGEDVALYPKVIAQFDGLADRIACASREKPILPGGGGSAAKLAPVHLASLLRLRRTVGEAACAALGVDRPEWTSTAFCGEPTSPVVDAVVDATATAPADATSDASEAASADACASLLQMAGALPDTSGFAGSCASCEGVGCWSCISKTPLALANEEEVDVLGLGAPAGGAGAPTTSHQ